MWNISAVWKVTNRKGKSRNKPWRTLQRLKETAQTCLLAHCRVPELREDIYWWILVRPRAQPWFKGIFVYVFRGTIAGILLPFEGKATIYSIHPSSAIRFWVVNIKSHSAPPLNPVWINQHVLHFGPHKNTAQPRKLEHFLWTNRAAWSGFRAKVLWNCNRIALLDFEKYHVLLEFTDLALVGHIVRIQRLSVNNKGSLWIGNLLPADDADDFPSHTSVGFR